MFWSGIENTIGEAAKYLVEMTKATGRALAIEDLDLRQDKSVIAKFNRMAHGFCWSTFLQMVERAAKNGPKQSPAAIHFHYWNSKIFTPIRTVKP